jgi:valine--pyruvate aminotransferase
MNFSSFGLRFSGSSGILKLMDDLGRALSDAARSDRPVYMLGGGNPAHIPALDAYFHERMASVLANPGEFEHAIGDYDAPQGEQAFIQALADLLRRELHWPVQSENIALTNGSQSAFFFLFNLLAGDFADGTRKRILFPLTPEYIGYADLGLHDDLFIGHRPLIDIIGAHRFKYRVDFSQLNLDDSVGAICVSRPNNPTGNVLTDEEIAHLRELARAHEIPVILDNAYGTPFPGIVFTQATPVWDRQTVVCMSLSKLGLPGTRTGIVIADEPLIHARSAMNAVFNLASGSLGAVLAHDLVASGAILNLSQNLIQPYYRQRMEQAVAWLDDALIACDYFLHQPEGAFFLWLWLRDFPIGNLDLYERLKQRGVIVVSGHYFFPGLKDDWPHRHECLRISYTQDPERVRAGIAIIGEEVKKAYAERR